MKAKSDRGREVASRDRMEARTVEGTPWAGEGLGWF